MSNGQDEKGFSGLSSLASDVDETVGDSARRNVQGAKPAARGRSKDEQPPPRELAAKPRPVPPPQLDRARGRSFRRISHSGVGLVEGQMVLGTSWARRTDLVVQY